MTPAQAALRNRDDFDEALDPALTILITDRDGQDHRLPAEEGWRAMEVIRDWGLDIKAECGGACACATCHVYVDEAWKAATGEPEPMEEDMLDFAGDVRPTSRLSCQIRVTDDLNGLTVTVPDRQA